jgi:serine phosphatase RsbU (regulator of sigma subunit)/DNA-binding transcriptional regulator YhcF (GntR family)
MALLNDARKGKIAGINRRGEPARSWHMQLAQELFEGRYRPGQRLELREIAAKHKMDDESVLKAFAEFQALGMVTLSGNFSAVFHSRNPKEMQEAYELRAAVEEIAGRTAAAALKGNCLGLEREVEAMRTAVADGNLDAYAEHDVNFHRGILKASENDVLLRVWDTLMFDLRIRAAVATASKDLPEVVESHQPIVDALAKGRGREAGLLLRNHVETFLEFLKKAESDSGLHKAFRKDLEGAKDVQRAFFPPQSFAIPCLSCETFYQPARGIGGDYYDFLSLQGGRWGIAIGDVCGKGIGAALLMASLQASLRAQTLHPYLDLPTLIGDVNRLVCESSPTYLFASLFYAEYEPATRVLNYVNAGHTPPIVVRPGKGSSELFHLSAEGMPMGISADARFEATRFQLMIDDILVAYTDGITEAVNRSSDLWGIERLDTLLRSCGGMTSGEVVSRILGEVSEFANGEPQRDDVTLVVMNVQEGCEV